MMEFYCCKCLWFEGWLGTAERGGCICRKYNRSEAYSEETATSRGLPRVREAKAKATQGTAEAELGAETASQLRQKVPDGRC